MEVPVVYKVLNIAASVLMGLAVPVAVVCLVYTLAMPTVRAGIDDARTSFDNAVSAAAAAVGVDVESVAAWGANASSLLSGLVQEPSESGGVADAAQAEAFAAWRDVVGDPVGSVLEGSGVTTTVLAGVAGGSASAGDVLAALDETALTVIDANARSYAAQVAGAEVSSALPEDVRAQMQEANAAARSFATSVQQLVGEVRELKAGGVGARAALATTATAAVADASTIERCVSAAEEGLR